jgi:hypothetical protein
MWRSRRDLIRACASLIVLSVSVAACFMVVALSWPDQLDRRDPVRVGLNGCCDVVVARSVVGSAEVLPTTVQTGSIRVGQR